jgi:hypothetical protein
VQFFVLRPMDAEAAAAAAAEGAHVGVRVRRTALTLAAMETLLQVCACACVCGGGGGRGSDLASLAIPTRASVARCEGRCAVRNRTRTIGCIATVCPRA